MMKTYPLAVLSDGRDEILKALVRQAQRYHLASLQDENLVIAARHNAYASGIISVVSEQSDEAEVLKVSGISLKDLRKQIFDMQDKLETLAFDLLSKSQPS